jgi:hypothetical protein
VGFVAILAIDVIGDVVSEVDGGLGVMDVRGGEDGGNVGGRNSPAGSDVAAVADETGIRDGLFGEEIGSGGSGVSLMAVIAVGVLLDVGGRAGNGHGVAGVAEFGVGVGHDEEVAVAVGVGIMAGGALEVFVFIETNGRWEERGVFKFGVFAKEGGVVNKGDGVVVGEISAEVGFARGEGGDASGHLDRLRAGVDGAEGDGAIVAGEAELRGAGRLAGESLE